jgi:hypothetical protein
MSEEKDLIQPEPREPSVENPDQFPWVKDRRTPIKCATHGCQKTLVHEKSKRRKYCDDCSANRKKELPKKRAEQKAKETPIKCETPGCPNTFIKTPNRKYCDDCFKGRKKGQRMVEWRERKTERESVEAARWDSKESVKKDAALEIIADAWGITRSHIIETVYTWGSRASEQLKLTNNVFFWTHGPKATKESFEGQQAIDTPKIEDENNIVVGEVTYKRELFVLYIFIEAWRADATSFPEWLAERRSCKTDGAIKRGNKYFGRDFHDKPHGRWEEMFVKWNPDGLEPDYDQESAKRWLASQSEDKKRLLIACRSSYKSNYSLISLIAAVLCLPDIRLLFVTETRPLSLEFLAGFRRYFEISNPREPRKFVRLFPEYCVEEGDGKASEFLSPMRILGLFQPTANSTSMESGGWAGSRADYCLLSDCISSGTVGTEAQIQKSVDNTDAILELIEVGGYVHWEGTPWHENDLYAQIMERNERSLEKDVLVIVDPAWVAKEHAKAKDIWSLQEEDVDLLFPARLTWDVLQKKLHGGDPAARKFRMQSLCMFLSEEEDSQKLHFDRVWITRNTLIVPPSINEVYGSADIGFSKSKYRDPSALTLWNTSEIRTRSPLDGSEVVTRHVSVLTQEVGHWDTQEKAAVFVRLARMYPEQFKTWIIEKYPQSDDLDRAIQQEAMKYGLRIGIYWSPIVQGVSAKFHSLKAMETPLQNDLIKFVAGPYLENLIIQLEQLDDTGPKRQSSTRKDDSADSLQLGIRYLLATLDSDAELKKLQQAEREKQQLKFMHDRIFGSPAEVSYQQPQQEPYNDGRGIYGIPGLRGFGRR